MLKTDSEVLKFIEERVVNLESHDGFVEICFKRGDMYLTMGGATVYEAVTKAMNKDERVYCV